MQLDGFLNELPPPPGHPVPGGLTYVGFFQTCFLTGYTSSDDFRLILRSLPKDVQVGRMRPFRYPAMAAAALRTAQRLFNTTDVRLITQSTATFSIPWAAYPAVLSRYEPRDQADNDDANHRANVLELLARCNTRLPEWYWYFVFSGFVPARTDTQVYLVMPTEERQSIPFLVRNHFARSKFLTSSRTIYPGELFDVL